MDRQLTELPHWIPSPTELAFHLAWRWYLEKSRFVDRNQGRYVMMRIVEAHPDVAESWPKLMRNARRHFQRKSKALGSIEFRDYLEFFLDDEEWQQEESAIDFWFDHPDAQFSLRPWVSHFEKIPLPSWSRVTPDMILRWVSDQQTR